MDRHRRAKVRAAGGQERVQAADPGPTLPQAMIAHRLRVDPAKISMDRRRADLGRMVRAHLQERATFRRHRLRLPALEMKTFCPESLASRPRRARHFRGLTRSANLRTRTPHPCLRVA